MITELELIGKKEREERGGGWVIIIACLSHQQSNHMNNLKVNMKRKKMNKIVIILINTIASNQL